MGIVTAAVLAGTAIYGAIDANQRKKQAEFGIQSLKKRQPRFKSAKEIQMESEAAVQEGYSAAEIAQFQQRMARGSRAAYQQGVQTNPNLAGALQSGLNYANVAAQVDFAANDAALRRERIAQYAQNLTGQSNAQTNADIQSKREQEVAYGTAKSQASQDFNNSIMKLAYAGASGYKAVAEGGTTPTPTGNGNSLGGQAPFRTLQAPDYGSEQWGGNLYREVIPTEYQRSTPHQRYTQPIMTNPKYKVDAQPIPIGPPQVGVKRTQPQASYFSPSDLISPYNGYNPYYYEIYE